MALYEKHRSQNGFYKAVGNLSHGLTFHAHLHTSFELLHVFEGTISVWVNRQKYVLNKGQQILILPNMIHEYKTEKSNTLSRLIIFSVDYLPEIAKEAKSGLFRHPILEYSSENFCKLIDLHEDHFLFRSELYRIAAQYAKNDPIPVTSRQSSDFAQWLSEYLEAHCTEKISEKTVAKAIGYHPRYLSLLINQNFGVSFKILLNEYRIRIAKTLLSDSAKSITEIYTAVGFDSQSSFNRNFKLITGVTPREYRAERSLIPQTTSPL